MNLLKQIFKKEDIAKFQNKDAHLERTLRIRDFLALGVGTIVSTAIFTLPGVVAADHTGPSVSFLSSSSYCSSIGSICLRRNGICHAFAGSALYLD